MKNSDLSLPFYVDISVIFDSLKIIELRKNFTKGRIEMETNKVEFNLSSY